MALPGLLVLLGGRAGAQDAVAVRGVVRDSLHGGVPMPEAEVMLDGVDAVATTDAEGRFRFPKVPPGRYRVTFFHARLDALGLAAPVRTVEIGPGDADVQLFVPTGVQLVTAACGAGVPAGGGVVAGRVVRGTQRRPESGATVRVAWRQLDITAQGLSAVPRALQARTDADGQYRVCGVPTDGPVQVAVHSITGDHEARDLTLDGEFWATHTVTFGEPPAEGTALQIRVRNVADLPVRGAVVALDTLRQARTDADGMAQLADVRPGDRALEVRALGFRPMTVPLAASARRITVRLEVPVTTLATRTITARRAARDPTGFEQRRLADVGGSFLTSEQIASRRAARVSDLFAGIPGVSVTPHGRSNVITMGRSIGSRGAFGTRCYPVWYVDGTLILEPTRNLATADTTPNIERDGLRPDMLDQLASPQDLAGIEIYRSAISAPPQFATIGAECGVIVVWTKRGEAALLPPP